MMFNSAIAGGINVYICKGHQVDNYIVTDDDKKNPNYTDACFDGTNGEKCSYCCIINLNSCSRDNRACSHTRDRHFENLVIMVAFIASVACGCSVLAQCINCFVNVRCCHLRYPGMAGASCVDMVLRIFCYCCVDFGRIYKRREKESLPVFSKNNGGDEELQPLNEDKRNRRFWGEIVDLDMPKVDKKDGLISKADDYRVAEDASDVSGDVE